MTAAARASAWLKSAAAGRLRAAAAISFAVLFVVGTLLTVTPGGAWYLFPAWRGWLVELVLWRYDNLDNRSIGSVHALLQDADEVVPPYIAVLVGPAQGPTLLCPQFTGYFFRAGSKGEMRLIGPPLSPAADADLPFTPDAWRQADASQRRRMLPDLIASYRAGRWSREFSDVRGLTDVFGDGFVGEQWVYRLNGQELVVRFDRFRRVAQVQRVPRGTPLSP